MQFQILLLSSLTILASSSPISSPLEYGSIDPISREYMSTADESSKPLKRIQDLPTCYSLDNVTMDAGTLPPPSAGLKLWHVAIGRGTQNYSCTAATSTSSPPVFLGAAADLFNATCSTGILGNAFTDQLTSAVAQQDQQSHIAKPLFLSGHHYFADVGKTAVFNLHTGKAPKDINYGVMFAKKTDAINAPADSQTSQDGSTAVPWLKLAVELPPLPPYSVDAADAAPGVAEVYRIHTAGGTAPPTCEGNMGKTFEKQYAAVYWFWHTAS